MRKTTLALGLGAALAGCSVLAAFADLLEVYLLGVMPEAGFTNSSSVDYGLATVAVGAEDEDGIPVAPLASLLAVESDDGTDVSVEGKEKVDGHDEGSFVFLSDGSGSMSDSDPQRYRADAVTQLADELPVVASAIAKAHCGGHTRLLVRWEEPPEAGTLVSGQVRVKGTDLGAPFAFVAP